MFKKSILAITALMFVVLGASAINVGVGISRPIGWGVITTTGDSYPIEADISITNGIEVGTFTLIFDAAPTGSVANISSARLGIESPAGFPGTNQNIQASETLTLTFTNFSPNITNFLFTGLGTYLLNNTNNNTNLVTNESITLFDGDMNPQVIEGAGNQNANTISNLLQSVSDGETFTIETASNSAWRVNNLDFEVGIPFTLPSTTALIVDFTDDGTRDNGGILRAADVGNTGTDTNGLWNFSDERAGTPQYLADGNDQAGDSSQRFYGGLQKTMTGNTFSVLGNNQDGSLISGSFRNRYFDGGTPLNVTMAFKGAYVWAKEDFLSNTNDQLEFAAGDSMTLTGSSAGDVGTVRMVVRQAGTYYASSNSASAGFTIDDFASETWGELNTNDYTVGAFAPLSITDIEAVGFTFDFSDTATAGTTLLCQLNWSDFQVFASIVGATGPTVGPLSIEPLNTDVVISWQAGAEGTHTLQTRPALTFGTWSNLTAIVPGVETTLSVTTTATEAESFYRVSAE